MSQSTGPGAAAFQAPNWKDASAYPSPGSASNARFAWEFLRRNADYQAIWARYIRTLREGTVDDAKAATMVDFLDAMPEGRQAIAAERYSNAELWNAAWRQLEDKPCMWVTEALDDTRTLRRSLSRAMALPWGLEDLASPLCPYDVTLVRFANSKRTIQPSSYGLKELEDEHAASNEGSFPGSFLLRSKWLVLQIDLEMPAEVTEQLVIEQIRSARRIRTKAGSIKPVDSRARSPDRLVEGLRLLDAFAAHADLKDIGKQLCPSEANDSPDYTRDKRLRAAFKAACELRDGGYRFLPLLKDKSAGGRKKK